MKPKTLRTLAVALVLVAVALLFPGDALFAAVSADGPSLSNGTQGRATVDPDGRVETTRLSSRAQGRATVDLNGCI